MKILGNRVLVSKIEDEVKEGFNTVDIQDSFVFKGRVEQLGEEVNDVCETLGMKVGDTIMFRKYSPNTEDIEVDGKKLKVVDLQDVIAML